MAEPAYVTIAGEYAQQIHSAVLPSGTQLPSAREMCKRHGVSEIVIRNVIRLLKDQGLVRTVPARGTFVADKPVNLDPPEPPVATDSDNDIERVRATADPIRRAQLASELITEYQLRVAELSGIRQTAIEAAHDEGLSFTEIGQHLGLTKSRISQIRHSDR
ncbi:GntR family transcriptional regulator [Nocardia vinacea]|uniref:GntR family transcriptional regulator n=1 Tax=Nocardia vinacea TaxID=96468 RepID=UPI0033F9C4AB